MVLWLIGLGLYDEHDVTLRGLEAIKGCARVYLEMYTSILMCDTSKLERLYGKEVIVADRDMVESQADEILDGADEQDVAFLVVGDPFGATTHTDLQVTTCMECNASSSLLLRPSPPTCLGSARAVAASHS